MLIFTIKEEQSDPEVIKRSSAQLIMLSSAEHEILNAHKFKSIKEISFIETKISQ